MEKSVLVAICLMLSSDVYNSITCMCNMFIALVMNWFLNFNVSSHNSVANYDGETET